MAVDDAEVRNYMAVYSTLRGPKLASQLKALADQLQTLDPFVEAMLRLASERLKLQAAEIHSLRNALNEARLAASIEEVVRDATGEGT